MSEITRISRVTINKLLHYYKKRKRIALDFEKDSPLGLVEIELDESCFGAKRVRGRGAAGKTLMFGTLKRQDKSIPK